MQRISTKQVCRQPLRKFTADRYARLIKFGFIFWQDGDQVSDSDNTSSVATAQMPVPLQRSSIRRNEYVNIPIPQKVKTTFQFSRTVSCGSVDIFYFLSASSKIFWILIRI
jgi:hypothetical protein